MTPTEKEHMLETLKRLKHQIDCAIELVLGDRMHVSQVQFPGRRHFRIGHFEITDTTAPDEPI